MSDWRDDVSAGESAGTAARLCGLEIQRVREVESLGEAWALLPATGEGWVCLADEVRRYSPNERGGPLLTAEVATGSTTYNLRFEAGRWTLWTWCEVGGETHRVVSRPFLSAELSRPNEAPKMRYATYWTRSESSVDGVALMIWQPVGSRFVGWEE